jgi:hypothetical protein
LTEVRYGRREDGTSLFLPHNKSKKSLMGSIRSKHKTTEVTLLLTESICKVFTHRAHSCHSKSFSQHILGHAVQLDQVTSLNPFCPDNTWFVVEYKVIIHQHWSELFSLVALPQWLVLERLPLSQSIHVHAKTESLVPLLSSCFLVTPEVFWH